MSNLLVVFGATGQQGGSVIDYVLNDPELSRKYKIRAVTRDVNSDKAKQLEKKKIEVVPADTLDRTALESAFTGAHTVYAMTTPAYGPDALEIEYNCGKIIADVAVEKSVEYIVFSTLPSPRAISGGKYTKVTPFDAKAKVEQYIRSLHIKSAFISPGYFMENFQSQPFMAPRQASDGTWVLSRHNSPTTQLPYIDAVGDLGKFVGAILAEPGRYQGQTFCAARALYSWEEVAAILSKTSGRTVVYRQVSREEFKKSLPFDSDISDIFVEGLSCQEEFGYFGPDSKGLVAWAAENARGRLSSFEEYFQTHTFQLT